MVRFTNPWQILIWIFYGAATIVTIGRAITRFMYPKKYLSEDYLIFIGWACLTALSIVITIMTPKFVAYSNLYAQAFTNPSVMTEPGSNKIIEGVSTGLKLMFK